MSYNRTKKASINAIVSLVSQILQIIMGFIIRKFFIQSLGVSYLGYNSVFSNILQMLNLADMGIGVAITSYLYLPLAEGDNKKINSLMMLYKKVYRLMGVAVIVVGIVTSFFLGVLIPDAACNMGYLRILFYINLAGTASTYFLAFKRTLIIADQKSYLANIVDTFTYLIMAVLQLLSLIILKNYIIFLMLTVLRNMVSNILISKKTNQIYGDLYADYDPTIAEYYKPKIRAFVQDVFISKIGAAIYYGTDNIILSVLKGSLLTGFLSNYTLITTQLNTIVVQMLNSLQATYGNYIATNDDTGKQCQMTDYYFCANFFLGNFCFICFTLLAQPFVKLFFGENMLLAFSTAFLLGLNLLLSFLIQLPSQVFVIYKLYKYDKPIIVISASLNIVISVFLANQLGINGVLIGTTITSLIYLFSRFYVIGKHVYNVSYTYYLRKFIIYFIVSAFAYLVTYIVSNNFSVSGYSDFTMRLLVVVFVSIFSTVELLSFTKEFNYLLYKFLPQKIIKYINNYSITITFILILTVSVFIGGKNKVDFSTMGNKSYQRTDSYLSDDETGKNIFHLSFDDTILLFKDLNENQYSSIFEQPTLAWFKQLHEKYGVVISCFVYYEDGDFNLSQMSDGYIKEFNINSDWLRFGFHTLNGSTNYSAGSIIEDYEKTISQLERIVGKESIDNFVRLQMFKGNYDGIKPLIETKHEPIVGLLSADDRRQSYYLSEDQNKYIYSHDELFEQDLGLYFVSTDFRIEYVDNINKKIKELSDESWINQTGDLVVFTHEWALSVENKEKIEKVCKYAMQKGYRFVFLEDEIKKNKNTMQTVNNTDHN